MLNTDLSPLSAPAKREVDNTPPSSAGKIASPWLFLLPCAVGGLCAVGYAVKLLSVQPPGKESRIEEGLYSLAFHAICLAVVFPLFIVVTARNWYIFRCWWGKLLVVVAVLVAMALVVVLPEFVVNRAREKRSYHFDGSQ